MLCATGVAVQKSKGNPEGLAQRVYEQLKADLFDFRLLPGDRFSESDVALRMQTSRTPVRQALFRLEREGFVEVYYRSGWQVRAFDFKFFEEMYDVRIALEFAAVEQLCVSIANGETALQLNELRDFWCVAPELRLVECEQVSAMDERFHNALVEATGNEQMTKMHWEVTEKIRIIRRLDFTKQSRIAATYDEHKKILQLIFEGQVEHVKSGLKAHILASKNEVRRITMHRIQIARQTLPGSAL